MLKGGVTLMLDLAYLKSTYIPNFEQLLLHQIKGLYQKLF